MRRYHPKAPNVQLIITEITRLHINFIHLAKYKPVQLILVNKSISILIKLQQSHLA